MTFTFKTADGKTYTTTARDMDRARSAAKKQALESGGVWTKAELVKATNAL